MAYSRTNPVQYEWSFSKLLLLLFRLTVRSCSVYFLRVQKDAIETWSNYFYFVLSNESFVLTSDNDFQLRESIVGDMTTFFWKGSCVFSDSFRAQERVV